MYLTQFEIISENIGIVALYKILLFIYWFINLFIKTWGDIG